MIALGPAAARHPVWMSQGRLAVLGTGAMLPGPPVTTQALVDRLSDRFGLTRGREAVAVARRMAIRTRHFARDFTTAREDARAGNANPALAAGAVTAALADAGMTIGDIGFLIGHTATPSQPLPSNTAFAADLLGYAGPHLELREACTGFAGALTVAFGLSSAPAARPVAIVGSETGSLFFDPGRVCKDNGQLVNLVQMGDGAAAIILGPAAVKGASIGAAWSGSIGLGRAPGIQMRDNVREFDHDFAAIRDTGTLMFDAGYDVVLRHGVAPESIDTIIPHQVSGRIGRQCAVHFGRPTEQFFVNADRVGNTGSAAILLALAHLRAERPAARARALVLGAEASKYMHGGFVYDHG